MSASASPTKKAASATTASMSIKDYKYTVPSSVKPGEKVTVKNNDTEAHSVTVDSGSSFAVVVPAGGSASFTAPSKAGSYAFHCIFHSNMHATLVVS